MPSTDETMERLKKQSDRILSEIGYLSKGIREQKQDRLTYIASRVAALDIESLAIQREAEGIKKG